MEGRNFMKKFLLIIVLMFCVIFGTSCNNEKENKVIRERKDLSIISSYGNYILAIDNTEKVIDMIYFSIFKEGEYNEFEKVFTLNDFNLNSSMITWYNDNIYIFQYNGAHAYNFKTGEKIDGSSGIITIFPDDSPDDLSNGEINSVLGNDGTYIYYKYSKLNSNKYYYGKIDLELTMPQVIEENEIPIKYKK